MDEVASHTGNKWRQSLCQSPDFYKMATGKKRAGEMEPREEKKRKRVRVEGPSVIKIKKVPKQKARAQLNGISTFI